jgi:dTDP-4-amino-4,6-dideoxygalactose transaminase
MNDREFLVFGSPSIEQAEIDDVAAVMRSGWLGTGPRVAEFEQRFAVYRRAARAAAVNSCTAALHLAAVASGLGPGDEVITTPLTFVATINVILHVGATPVLADVDPRTMNIDPARIAERITRRTAAILPVHFAGRACDMTAIMKLARRHGLRVIEDCAHAIETDHAGKPVGTFGDFGCFSFYVTKNLVTGEGGMVLAKRAADHDRIKALSLHGIDRDAWKRFGASGYKHYTLREPGFKYNMMDLQAAIGLRQLERIERAWTRRREVWQHYDEALRDLPLALPAPPAPGSRHAFHLYTVLVDRKRDEFLVRMKEQGIGVGVHYQSAVEHRYYRDRLGWSRRDCPVARDIGRRTVSLPLSAKLTDADVERVIAGVKAALTSATARRPRR